MPLDDMSVRPLTGASASPAGQSPVIGGTCDPRFAAVLDAFAANFTERGEVGGAVCLSVDGRVVADLWGGWSDGARSRPWRQDTLVNVFSVGKGLTALCAARLMGQGRLDADAPVARYWPEFASAGKEAITVRQLLSHQAGLAAVRRRMPPGSMFDWKLMTAALAAERPWWPPGSAHGYHVNTFGFLAGEVIRRAAGRTLGRLLREDVAGPLGADVHIGVPASELHRVAEFGWPMPRRASTPDGMPDDQLLAHNAYFNPAGLSGAGVVNTRDWRMAEIPSANCHGTAPGVARIYAALAAGGTAGGVRVVSADALAAAATEQVYGQDRILRRPSRFGLGFQLTQKERPLGPNGRTFGHFGAGGSLGFCDQDAQVGFGYVTNQMGPRWQNPRNRALLNAIYASL